MRIVEMNGWTIVTWKMIWTNKMLSYQNMLFQVKFDKLFTVSFVIGIHPDGLWHSFLVLLW